MFDAGAKLKLKQHLRQIHPAIKPQTMKWQKVNSVENELQILRAQNLWFDVVLVNYLSPSNLIAHSIRFNRISKEKWKIGIIPRQNSFFENVPPNFSDIRTESGDTGISWYTEIFSESLSYYRRFHVRIKKQNKQMLIKKTQNQSEWHVSAKVTAMHI